MKIIFFSAKPYDKEFFNRFNQTYDFEIEYHETHLGPHIVNIVQDAEAICVFVNDKLTEKVIQVLADKGVKVIALRCAGFNNVDLEAAKRFGITVCRVPAYSPEAVAEHALAMLQTINRKTHKAYNRVREQNFALNGLLGFNLHGKTVGIIGTGKIGKAFAQIMLGFGCKVLAYDLYPDDKLKEKGITYVSLEELLETSDIVSLHCPLTKENHYFINKETLALTKRGIVIINTSRGGLINTNDIIQALTSQQVGALCIDVYEQEEKLFFRDLSTNIIDDDNIHRLMSYPNVLITAHQAFFTEEALSEIAQVTLHSIDQILKGNKPEDKTTLLT
ncbi:2-hydroxyacid dehydrogenase [Pareuzebyella sediminis]|uniref:2-hydroxyacid dehydrogenase n=1 Tax=Pareuzebyella sediminis TaxID=2607998 RepID=UPI0011EBED31|nr:2-hydroxyacid dehydrogenase [Pareuzebyella sediminis]